MKRSFAAVDLGATSGRVVVGTFVPDGTAHGTFLLDEVHRFTNTPVTIDGVLCWDVDELFDQTLTGLAHAVARTNELDADLLGIAIDSWGVDYGLVDADDRLVAPVRHYRAAEQGIVTAANANVPAAEAYARTGITELAINTCFQLIRDARKGLLTPGITALMVPDLWTAWLTGRHGTERTIASTTGLLDWRTRTWAEDLMARWGIPTDVLAPIVETGACAGFTLHDITTRIGADHAIAVYRAPAHDTASAFAAVTGADTDRAVISCGTWALVGCVNSEPVLTPQAQRAGFTNEVAADGSALLVRNLSGTWLLEECVRVWAATDGTDDTRTLRDALLAQAENDDARVIGTIDCGSPALIGTTDMPTEITSLYRKTDPDAELSRAQLVRLILESLADSFATTIAQVEALTGTTISEVTMIGGGSRIAQLVDLTARATGRPVHVSHQEATSIGNICVQAVSAGVFDTIDQARIAVAAQSKGTT